MKRPTEFSVWAAMMFAGFVLRDVAGAGHLARFWYWIGGPAIIGLGTILLCSTLIEMEKDRANSNGI